jgi:glutaredoxin 3
MSLEISRLLESIVRVPECTSSLLIGGVFSLLIVVALCGVVSGEIFHYVDSEGKSHYVTSADRVPSEYQTQVGSPAALPNVSRGGAAKYNYQPTSPAKSIDSKVIVFVTSWCPYCKSLESFLTANKVPFTRYDVERDLKGAKLYKSLGVVGYPVTKIGKEVIRGFNKARFQEILAENPSLKSAD